LCEVKVAAVVRLQPEILDAQERGHLSALPHIGRQRGEGGLLERVRLGKA
jgi:hypothetical protein